MPFGDSHKRHLLTCFEHVDQLLAEAYARLVAGDSAPLFPQHVADATPAQCQTVGDYLDRFRHLARRFLDAQQIRDERPRISALWAFRTAVTYAASGLDEITPGRMTGYGPLDPPLAQEIERTLADLQAVLNQLNEYLEGGLGGDIGARLARLDQTRRELALLRELDQVVARHGLVEFRATLDWLVGKFEQGWLEVALFGRVSCGKSSLLNALLERPVLPVGVTPVTAVPTRIVPGDAVGAIVHFAREKSQRIELSRLAEFAAEEGNPGNAKRVVDIVVELPMPRFGAGISFVDTPGLGSLATAGAAQTLAYLPRSDVGVLLIDAAGTLTAEDVAVARKLLEAGAELVVVLSKADLLAPAEQERLAAYVQHELAAALGLDIAVSAVSALAEGGRQALAWSTGYLAPRLQERRAVVEISLRRKVGALREAVVAALKVRRGDRTQRLLPSAIDANLAEGRRALAEARRRIRDLAFQLPRPERIAAFLAVAADTLTQAWRDGLPADRNTQETVALALAREADQLGGEFERAVGEVRQSLHRLLAETIDAPEGESAVFTPPGGRPLFDPSPLVSHAHFEPGLLAMFGDYARQADAHHRIEAALAGPLDHVLRTYADALEHWASEAIAALAQEFDAASAAASALSRIGQAAESETISPEVDEDLQRLSAWNEAQGGDA